MTGIHGFWSTEEAYNQSQCRDEIKDGDILLTPHTVGVLVQAWPVAVCGEVGAFHTVQAGMTLANIDDGKYAESVELATQIWEGRQS